MITWKTTLHVPRCVTIRRKKKATVARRLRYYSICPVPEDLPDRSRWADLKAIGIAISDTQRDGKEC